MPVRRLVGAALAMVLAVVFALARGMVRADDGAIGRERADAGRAHVAEGTHVEYPEYPPTSGPHWPAPAPWGVYDEPVPPERWVHNLEHGGIVVLYRCDTPCPDLVTRLRELATRVPREPDGHAKLLVAPDPRLPARLALLAWRWRATRPALDDARVLAFYRAHVDRAPEDVP